MYSTVHRHNDEERCAVPGALFEDSLLLLRVGPRRGSVEAGFRVEAARFLEPAEKVQDSRGAVDRYPKRTQCNASEQAQTRIHPVANTRA